jgi:hypothetical protein
LLAAARTPTKKPADDAAADVADLDGPFAVFERTTVGVPVSMPANSILIERLKSIRATPLGTLRHGVFVRD